MEIVVSVSSRFYPQQEYANKGRYENVFLLMDGFYGLDAGLLVISYWLLGVVTLCFACLKPRVTTPNNQ